MNTTKLIEQIGGRDAVEDMAEGNWPDSGFYENIKLMSRALLEVMDAQAIGEVRLGDYLEDGTRPAMVVCLHDQADWENFADGTKLYANPPAAIAPEWSNAQCMEFLTVAFRHCDISGDIEMDDIRLGVKMANAAATAPDGTI